MGRRHSEVTVSDSGRRSRDVGKPGRSTSSPQLGSQPPSSAGDRDRPGRQYTSSPQQSGYGSQPPSPASMRSERRSGNSSCGYSTPPAGCMLSKTQGGQGLPPSSRMRRTAESVPYETQYIGASCDEKKSRCKKSGYAHPAAKASMPDLLSMPPQYEQAVKQIDPYASRGPVAGVTSSRLTAMDRCDHVFSNNPKASGRQKMTDPITHRAFESHILDAGEENGAAGHSSTRLTELFTDWAEIPRGPSHGGFHPPDRTDPISHRGDRDPERVTRGVRRHPEKGGSKVVLGHYHEPVRLSKEEIKANGSLRKQKEIGIQGGAILYNVGGECDLLPAATEQYMAADQPISRSHRIENDKKFFPNCIHGRFETVPSRMHATSQDVRDICHGAPVVRDKGKNRGPAENRSCATTFCQPQRPKKPDERCLSNVVRN